MSIPEQATEAAAKAYHERTRAAEGSWESQYDAYRFNRIWDMRRALEAAAPAIVAKALRDAAEEFEYGAPPAEYLNERADHVEGHA